ncbi:MAG: hypothetical protein IKU53_03915 [Firmicutes bacterium]|nr:hypothetical protein [Bacillota bacterium]
MKIYKRICILMVAILILATSVTTYTYAAVAYNPQEEVSLEIKYEYENTPLSNATFSIYYVAEVDIYGEITPVSNFEQFNMTDCGSDATLWKNLASQLEIYVEDNNITPTDYGVTNEDGELAFPNNVDSLKPGMYLVIGEDLVIEYYIYSTSPFLVTLPTADTNDNWVYNVGAEPKSECTFDLNFGKPPVDNPPTEYNPNDDDPDKPNKPNKPDKPNKDRLPQTGQLWWPVPALLLAGITFVSVGIAFRRGTKDEK